LILTFLTFWPALGALLLILMKRPADLPDSHGHEAGEAEPGAKPARDGARTALNAVAMLFALVNFAASVGLLVKFNYATQAGPRNMQFIESHPWMTIGNNIHIYYRMGVDGISLLLIVLTTLLTALCVLYSFRVAQRLKEFMVFLLLLETGMIGVFCALDLVLFYVFWEAMLIPMYFLIGIFGHERRVYAAIKFFLFTFAGSILMLVAIIWTYNVAGSFNVLDLSSHGSGPGALLSSSDPRNLMWVYAAFALAFMIKVPMFPLHTWLPDAHVEAPTAGSVILAGVMLKMGTYGFLRFCLPMFPVQAYQSAPLFIALAITGIIYGSIVAAVQPDAKKLVAYSSVAHLGFVILGIFTFTRVGMMGALVQNLNHGISTPMLFFIVGMLYDRRHTRLISDFGGLKRIVPMLAAMTLIATLSSIAVPFFNGFVGEFPILLGSWTSVFTGYGPTALACTGMILSAVYMLWWFQRIMLGPVTHAENRKVPDLSVSEWLVLAPLVVVIFWVGLDSRFWTDRMTTSLAVLLPEGSLHMDPELPVTDVLALNGAEPSPLAGMRAGGRRARVSRPGQGRPAVRRERPAPAPATEERPTAPPANPITRLALPLAAPTLPLAAHALPRGPHAPIPAPERSVAPTGGTIPAPPAGTPPGPQAGRPLPQPAGAGPRPPAIVGPERIAKPAVPLPPPAGRAEARPAVGAGPAPGSNPKPPAGRMATPAPSAGPKPGIATGPKPGAAPAQGAGAKPAKAPEKRPVKKPAKKHARKPAKQTYHFKPLPVLPVPPLSGTGGQDPFNSHLGPRPH
jgi:NADH-quinone oxidoreductase subunit M